MTHARTQIREAVRTILEALNVATVYASRVQAVEAVNLPALLITTGGEEIERVTADGLERRTLEIEIDARAAGEDFDAALDELLASVETALGGQTLGGLVRPLVFKRLEVSAEAAGKVYGSARLTAEAIYFTNIAAPRVAL